MIPKENPRFKNKGATINLNYGRKFPFKKSLVFLITMVFIIIMVFTMPPNKSSGYVLFFVSVFILFSITATTGVVLFLDKNKHCYYNGAFGMTVGNEQQTFRYSCIVLKTTRKIKNRNMIYEDENTFSKINLNTTELYLMDSSHRKKIYCGSFEEYDKAKKYAKELSTMMELPIEIFSPKVNSRRR